MVFRSIISPHRLWAGAIPVMALLFGGCKGMRDSVNAKLYAPVDETGWSRDSLLVSSKPPVLFQVLHKGPSEYIFPMALLSKAPPLTMRLVTKRGWGMFDINLLFEGKPVTPVQDGFAGPTVQMRRGMWEIPSVPLDTIPGCVGALLPMGLVSLPSGTELVVANYKLPTGMKVLSPGELQDAIKEVPLLVLPTVQISASQLGRYTRSVHQIPRVGADPAVLLEYHDDSSVPDTSVVGQRRPRHVLIVLEKGVYGYRPSWTYTTTGNRTDRPVLRYLAIMDADMDGRAEIFFKWEPVAKRYFIVAYQQWNDTWKEYWRRADTRCDQ